MRRELLAILLLAAPAVALAVPEDCTPSSYAKLRPPKYPAQAVTERIEGKVLVAAVVETDGSPGQLEVRESSGNAQLDQAALDSVAEWRFNPMQCDGKATRSIAVVPVEFSLSDYVPDVGGESAAPGIRSRGKFRIELDTEPLEYSTLNDWLHYLQSDPGLEEIRTATGAHYLRASDSRVWELIESFDNPAPAAPNRLIIRQRWLDTAGSKTLLIGVFCGSTPTWCHQELTRIMGYMELNPPPQPPPAPRD